MKAAVSRWASAIGLAMLVAACGGGGGGSTGTPVAGGTGGTGISSGEVTAISSVTVNGVTYSCDGAIIEDDDGTVDQGPGDNCVEANRNGGLEPGMVVTIDGTANPPRATKVRIRPRVRGPIATIDAATNSFTVMGQRVVVDSDTKFKINGNRSVGTAALTGALSTGMTVQVSGFVGTDGAILATFVQTKNPNPQTPGEFEVKGIIDITGNVITLGNLTISLNGNITPALTDGLCVELKGRINASGTELTLTRAPKIDDDCDGLGDNLQTAEVEGIVRGFTSAAQEFRVGEQRVILAASGLIERDGTVAEDLVDGAKVEVEGSVSNGLLTARKITFKRSVRIQAAFDSVDSAAKTATIMGITIKWDSATRVQNQPSTSGGAFEIRGRKTGPTQVTATRIREKDDRDVELRGPVDAVPAPASPNFNILGVQIQTNGASFDDDDDDNGGSTTQAAFFAALKAGDVVKAKGERIGNTNAIAAEEVEFEDDDD